MSESKSESRGGGVLDRIGGGVIESVKAVPGGIADATYRNIWERLKNTRDGVKDVLGGLVAEPIRGLGHAVESLGELAPRKAILDIIKGARDGIARVFKGILNIGVEMPVKLAGAAGAGLLRTAAAPFGDISKLGGAEAAPA